jgi:hypothetical protein
MKRLISATVLALTLAAPIPALAWGDAPTHFSLSAELVNEAGSLPEAIAAHPQVFVQAAAAPDIASTALFLTTGRTYVHTLEFAESLLAVAQNDAERAMAYAWGAHVAADAVAHRSETNPEGYIPEAQPLHQLVEVAVDTVIFYDHTDFPPPFDLTSWDQVNVSFDANLLFRASLHYYHKVRRVPLVWPWVATQALQSLKTAITAEYDYIKLKKDASLSLAFLKDLAAKGILPSEDFRESYQESLVAAKYWIAGH